MGGKHPKNEQPERKGGVRAHQGNRREETLTKIKGSAGETRAGENKEGTTGSSKGRKGC